MDPIYHTWLEVPFLNLLMTFIMLAGLYQLGAIILVNKRLNKIVNSVSATKYQNIIISTNAILFFIFPLTLFLNSKLVLYFVAYSIFLLGVFKFIKKILNINLKKNFILNFQSHENYIILILFLGYLLISLAPPTSADSLDYHLFVAKHISQNGSFPNNLTHFHSIISGPGEIVIALGLLVGSEQLSSVLQFFGLVSIFGVIKKFKGHNIIIIALLSSPVVIFLLSTLKPQFFHIASNAFIFTIIYTNFAQSIFHKKENISLVLFSTIILIVSSQSKFSFLLSSFIISILILSYAFKYKFLKKTFTLFLLLFLFFYLPPLIWKHGIYGGNFFEFFYSPVSSNIHGHDEFKQMLKNVGNKVSPLWIIFPVSLKDLTQTLGIGSLIVLFLFKYFNHKYILFYFAILFFISISFLLGQNTARFFLEPFIWSLVLLSTVKNFNINKYFHYAIYLQTLTTFLMILYGVIFLTPAILTNDFRENIMKDKALGYSFFQWVEFETKDIDGKIMYFNRSVGIGKDISNTIPTDFRYYIFPDFNKAKKIFDQIKKINPKYAAFFREHDVRVYKNCLGQLVKTKKNIGYHATRNPLAKGNSYNGYVYEVNPDLFPECINIKETKWKK